MPVHEIQGYDGRRRHAPTGFEGPRCPDEVKDHVGIDTGLEQEFPLEPRKLPGGEVSLDHAGALGGSLGDKPAGKLVGAAWPGGATP